MNRTNGKIEHQDRSHLHVAIVVSKYHDDITGPLAEGAKRALKDAGVPDNGVSEFWVPGSYEIPQLAMHLAKKGMHQAIVCLGLILKGETTHDQLLATAVTNELLHIGTTTGVAIGLGVTTANTMEQAQARSSGEYNRGYEAAVAAIELAEQLQQI